MRTVASVSRLVGEDSGFSDIPPEPCPRRAFGVWGTGGNSPLRVIVELVAADAELLEYACPGPFAKLPFLELSTIGEGGSRIGNRVGEGDDDRPFSAIVGGI